jgi:hypothetical protein
VGKAIVILPPDMRREQVIQRCDRQGIFQLTLSHFAC